MKFVLLIAIGISLQTSLVIHIISLIGYISTKRLNHFKNFMITAITNVIFSLALALLVIVYPAIASEIKVDAVLIIESGMLFVYMLAIKVKVTIGIIKRARDPANYHFSFFGRKVYNTSIIDFKELLTYFVTFPFTMMAGAYFIVKIMRY